MAGSVLDSLVLEFDLDPTKFTRGLRTILEAQQKAKDETLRNANAIEANTRKIFDLITAVKRESVGAIAAVFGGYELVSFIDRVTALDAGVGRLAKTTGLSTEELSAWQGAVRQVGGSAESASADIASLNRELLNIEQTGQSSILTVLGHFGVDPFSNGRLKSPTQVLKEVLTAMEAQGVTDPREQAGFLRRLGISEDTINLLVKGTRGLNEFLEAARQAGTTTAQSAAAAAEYQTQLSLLNQAASNLARTLVTATAPALVGIMKILNEQITHSPKGIFSLDIDPNGLVGRIYNRADRGESVWEAIQNSNFTAAGRARNALAAGLSAQAAGGGEGGDNWSRFLGGLSYLETDQRNIGNSSSSAQGYFQFLSGTAARATGAGLPDPRTGSYQDQSAATMAYIQKFYPQAAAAIAKGQFDAAAQMLNKEWPSLPGGSQSQSASRYRRFNQILSGGASSVVVNMNGVTINAPSGDAQGIANGVAPHLKRAIVAAGADGGAH